MNCSLKRIKIEYLKVEISFDKQLLNCSLKRIEVEYACEGVGAINLAGDNLRTKHYRRDAALADIFEQSLTSRILFKSLTD